MRRAVLAILLLLAAACSAPPQKEIDRAQGAIEAARAAGAAQYAREPFAAAEAAMQQTHEAVQQRDYRLALSRATDAHERALEAAREAAAGRARAQSEAEAAIARVEAALRELDARLEAAASARVPPRETQAARRARAEIQRVLQEARAAAAAGNYPGATASAKGVPERVAAEIGTLNETIEARPARPVRRRR